MVLIVFLIDTSASMNQKTCLGTTYLDIAKGAVESFLKIRSRDQANRQDRYMLVTFDEPPNCVKSGWKENPATFNEELKNLQATGVSCVGPALKETFDLLNMHRLHTGIDNYGMGRNPYYFESSLVIAMTDGCSMTDSSGFLSELHLPMHNQMAGSELTLEPFRWDQRMFSLLLRIPGLSFGPSEKASSFLVEDAAITPMCEVTGGKSYLVTTHKILMQSLESIAQKIQPGVVINFEKFGPDPEPILREGARTPGNCTPKLMEELPVEAEDKTATQHHINGIIQPLDSSKHFQPIKSEGQDTSSLQVPDNPIRGENSAVGEEGELTAESERNTESPLAASTSWHSTRKMIFVRTVPKGSGGHWPIPESFWPDPGAHSLPPRDAQPLIKFSCASAEPMIIDNLPFDKYELEPSPLTQYILERKQPNVCWQTFVSGSGRGSSELGFPCGYLKASSNLQSVNFFVMPYNYPVLLPLLDELFKVHKLKPLPKWRQSFEHYLSTMPSYYAGHLRNALRRMCAPMNLVPDHIDGSLSFSIVTYLKKIKHQAKMESDRLVNMVSKKPPREVTQFIPNIPQLMNEKQKDYRQVLLRNSTTSSAENEAKSTDGILNDTLFSGLTNLGLPFIIEALPTQSYRNPFDIQRRNVVKHLKRMRANFFHFSPSSAKLQDEDSKHSVSIAQMGNYQEYLRNFVPLREVDPGQARVHTFGNPFKIKQDQFIAIDEADFNEGIGAPGQSPSRKRQNDSYNTGGKRRKRSETPPPSRRPVGPPNTPPPNIALSLSPIVNENEENKPENTKANSNGSSEDSKEEIGDNDNKTEDKIVENGLGVVEKRATTKLMNQQLKKLKDLHRGKQSKGEKMELVNGQVNNVGEESSPIASILRTSLVDSDDRIKLEDHKNNLKHSRLDDDGELDSDYMNRMKVEVLVNNARTFDVDDVAVKRRCRQQLQQGNNILLRLQAWKVIRGSKDAKEIIKLVEKLSGALEVKYYFIMDILEEADKFKLNSLVEKIKAYSETLFGGRPFLPSS